MWPGPYSKSIVHGSVLIYCLPMNKVFFSFLCRNFPYPIHTCIWYHTFFPLISRIYVMGLVSCVIFWSLMVILRVPTCTPWCSVGVCHLTGQRLCFVFWLSHSYAVMWVSGMFLLFLCPLWLFYLGLGSGIIYYIIGTTHLVYYLLFYLSQPVGNWCSNLCCTGFLPSGLLLLP